MPGSRRVWHGCDGKQCEGTVVPSFQPHLWTSCVNRIAKVIYTKGIWSSHECRGSVPPFKLFLRVGFLSNSGVAKVHYDTIHVFFYISTARPDKGDRMCNLIPFQLWSCKGTLRHHLFVGMVYVWFVGILVASSIVPSGLVSEPVGSTSQLRSAFKWRSEVEKRSESCEAGEILHSHTNLPYLQYRQTNTTRTSKRFLWLQLVSSSMNK